MKAVWGGFVLPGLISLSAVGSPFQQDGRRPPTGDPPIEAIEACDGRQSDSVCSFQAPHGSVEGHCRNVPEGLVCVPNGRRFSPAPSRAPSGEREQQRGSVTLIQVPTTCNITMWRCYPMAIC
jgi:hypothetical protein